MKTAIATILATASLVSSHATPFNIFVNGVDQGLGNVAGGYIRKPPNNDPIVDVTSSSMTCNVGGATAAGSYAKVAGGDKITIEWHHNDNSAADDIIAESHHGPIMTYIAPAKSNGEGNVWLKIQEDGYSNGKWAVDKLIANRGKYDVTLPDLTAGQYLLRSEVLALHEGNRLNGAQFYPGCIQIEVTSSGSVTLPAGVAIPGAYKADDKGVLFDIYNAFTSYPIPGPALWNGASGGSPSKPSTSAKPATSAKPTSAAPVSSAKPTSVKPATTSAPPTYATSPVPSAPKPTTLVTAVKPTTLATSAKPAPTSGSGSVQKYGQCGGKNYVGATACADGWVCKQWNEWYFQCVESA